MKSSESKKNYVYKKVTKFQFLLKERDFNSTSKVYSLFTVATDYSLHSIGARVYSGNSQSQPAQHRWQNTHHGIERDWSYEHYAKPLPIDVGHVSSNTTQVEARQQLLDLQYHALHAVVAVGTVAPYIPPAHGPGALAVTIRIAN